jgi:hypothetical protein
MVWKIDGTEKRFVEVLDHAVSDGPQTISHGGRTFVLQATEHETQPPFRTLAEALDAAPDLGELDLRRSRNPSRNIEW